MSAERPHFPFSAVAGQASFKLALLLAAVNPAIGGVLISGPRGCAKSTLARAMADLLPTAPQGFVTLPLGASDDMLVGTLDLQQVLNEQKVAFHPGLLSRAHQGVLYVDEVNLLADGLVDVLLDAAASGINRVERDGISHTHAAEFILVGTMNPDEGELRPQLQDRFGLAVELSNQYAISERMEIVRVREAFDRNPDAFCVGVAGQQAELIAQLQQARERLTCVTCAEQWREQIAERCFAAQVEGLRADIVWFRAAVTHAAWCGRDAVIQQDVDAVAELVLVHRRKVDTGDPSSGSNNSGNNNSGNNSTDNNIPDNISDDQREGGGQEPGQQAQSKHNPYRRPPESKRSSEPRSSRPNTQQASDQLASGDWGAMSQSQLQASVSDDSLGGVFITALERCCSDAREGYSKSAVSRGLVLNQPAKNGAQYTEQSMQGVGVGRKPNWFATLLASAGQWPPSQLRFRQPQPSQGVLHMVLLDTSGSGLAELRSNRQQAAGLLGSAKAAVLDIARGAYLKREQLSILGFGNQQVSNILPRSRAPKMLRAQLDAVVAGGGTPLREALQQTADYLTQLMRQQPQLQLQTYLISDGRSTQSLAGIKLPGQCVVIDTEMSTVKRGRGEQIAVQLCAAYLPLAQLA